MLISTSPSAAATLENENGCAASLKGLPHTSARRLTKGEAASGCITGVRVSPRSSIGLNKIVESR